MEGRGEAQRSDPKETIALGELSGRARVQQGIQVFYLFTHTCL